MGNTYVQAYFHLVFAVKNRKALIDESWEDKLQKYITGIVQMHSHKLIAIGGMPDHIHIFIGYNLNHSIPKLVEQIKTSSNQWINENRLSYEKFSWQNGYGAFTHSHSAIANVANYIQNQKQHHSKKSFKKEYLDLLSKHDIEFKDEYLFNFFDA